jgi:predicted transcriptional regulator
MKSSKPIAPEVLEQIPGLRKKGLSYYKIASLLGIGESTARKYKNYKSAHLKSSDQYIFTNRQLEIAIAAIEKNARK